MNQADINTLLLTARDRTASEADRKPAVSRLLFDPPSGIDEQQRENLIEEFLRDPSDDVRGIAVEACKLHRPNRRKMLWKEYLGHVGNVQALRELAELGDDTIIGECQRILRDGTLAEQTSAANALGYLDTTKGRAVLEEQFTSATFGSLKFQLAWGLSRYGGKRAVAFLERYLAQTSEEFERVACVCLLATARSEKGIEEVMRSQDCWPSDHLRFAGVVLSTLGFETRMDSSWQETLLDWVKNGGDRPGEWK